MGTCRRTPLAIANKKAAQKQAVIEQRLKNGAKDSPKTVKVGKGQYVELQREATDPVFVIIVEFGDQQYPNPMFRGTAGRRQHDGCDRPSPQRDSRAGPLRRQFHAVAGRLQQGPLRGHVFQSDGEVLPDRVLQPVLGDRRGPGLGQGALQRGALRPQLLRGASSAPPPRR